MIRVFIGWDPTEVEAWHVLAHSIYMRASVPVSIIPVKRSFLPYKHPKADNESTEFSMTRFLVPWMSGYVGTSIFMDCDMLMLGDVADLVADHDLLNAVSVVQHNHIPTAKTKMLGQKQSVYPKKNWSSVMVFSNTSCKVLTPEYVGSATGEMLHQFKWLEPETQKVVGGYLSPAIGQKFERIGALDPSWNHLVGYDAPRPLEEIKILHWTEGGPWWDQYKDTEYSDVWLKEREEMLNGN